MPRIYFNVDLREESNFCTIVNIVRNTHAVIGNFFKSHFLHQKTNYAKITEEYIYYIRCDCIPPEGTLIKIYALKEALSLVLTLLKKTQNT